MRTRIQAPSCASLYRATLPALLVLGMTALPAGAQVTRLSGFLDIAFGSTLAETREVMLDLVTTNDDFLFCDGGVFAGQDVEFWVFGFVDDQMHTAKAILEPDKKRLIATYQALLKLFTRRYGEPELAIAAFDDPYEQGDGFETYAISFGKGHFAALWTFPDGDTENAIAISIEKDLYIPIVFQHGALIDRALAKADKLSGS